METASISLLVAELELTKEDRRFCAERALCVGELRWLFGAFSPLENRMFLAEMVEAGCSMALIEAFVLRSRRNVLYVLIQEPQEGEGNGQGSGKDETAGDG